MSVTGVQQSVTVAVGGQGLYSKTKGVNFPNAGQRESVLEGCLFESRTLPWCHSKEQFIILASGQREVLRVQFPGSCIGVAGG